MGDDTEAGDTPLSVPFKRMCDIAIALTSILFILPLLVTVAACLLAVQGRPIFIQHGRVGKGGIKFKCWKFRTMVSNADELLARHLEADDEARAEWEATRKLKSDPRVTPFGRALRRSSVDELPQLFNVLIGDMSLVGPRPIVDDEVHRYGADITSYYRVNPGLTGLWQVSGRSNVSFQQRVRMDVSYVQTLSLKRDLIILAKTVRVVFGQNGSY